MATWAQCQVDYSQEGLLLSVPVNNAFNEACEAFMQATEESNDEWVEDYDDADNRN